MSPDSSADLAQRVEETASFLKQRFSESADIAVIAGSGLGGFARDVKPLAVAPYSEIPNVGASTVQGHEGKLVLGTVDGHSVWLFSGRRHIYEGISAAESTLLLRALLLANRNITSVIISNAAGGLNPTFQVGDLMLISDHINWMFSNPLLGPNVDDWGPRFPDMSDAYSRRLRGIAREVATASGIGVREGVYIAGHGPSYETRAEVGMLRTVFGGDAVGMSTATEALVAAQMGREVLGISFISNLLTNPGITTHEEVMEASRLVEGRFGKLVKALLPALTN